MTMLCPIANYLRLSLGVKVYVGPDYIRYEGGTFSMVTKPSEHVAAFILKFDDGQYPDLIQGWEG
jgi:hypothetical protein